MDYAMLAEERREISVNEFAAIISSHSLDSGFKQIVDHVYEGSESNSNLRFMLQ